MQALDRKAGPVVANIDELQIDIIRPKEIRLKNGIPVYVIDAGTQDLVKIEWVFQAGAFFQPKPFVAYATNRMLPEGTQKYSAKEIADLIDFYGAEIGKESEKDHASIILYTLNKHLEKTLPIIEEVIKHPVFPEEELSIIKQKQQQALAVNNQKVNYLARARFGELLFGDKHAYGHALTLTDIDTACREDILKFYKETYSSKGCSIIVSGRINNQCVDLLEQYFGGNDWGNDIVFSTQVNINPNKQLKHFVPKEEVLQSAIRIGNIVVNREHPDFMGLRVLNTVLGGYFGSRLMANIREDKGYTYGIGSAVVSFLHAGYFFITTEIDAEVTKQTLDEIYKEIKRLQNEKISASELMLVKNYMLGEFLRSIDGPLALSEKCKVLLGYKLDYSYYKMYLDTIKNITSEKLIDLANVYLKEDSLYELTVGKK